MKKRVLTSDRIDIFAAALRGDERSPTTVEKYLRDVRAFAEWLGGCPVTKEAAVQWKAYLQDMGHAPATINAKLSALNGLFQFYGWNDCRIKFLKVQRRVFRDAARELTKEDYCRLREAALRLSLDWLALLMETVCATGIRVSEVRYITVKAALIGRTDVSLKGKIRSVILPNKLCRKLLKYARKQKITSGAIFRTAGGELSRFQIWKAMKNLAKDAGVEPSKVFPHNLRHLFATTFYRATRDIVKLADLLGHSSINTTRIYLLTTGEEHAREVELLGLVS